MLTHLINLANKYILGLSMTLPLWPMLTCLEELSRTTPCEDWLPQPSWKFCLLTLLRESTRRWRKTPAAATTSCPWLAWCPTMDQGRNTETSTNQHQTLRNNEEWTEFVYFGYNPLELEIYHWYYVTLLQKEKEPLQLKEKSLVKINKSFVLQPESKAVLYLYDAWNFLSRLHITNETL